MGIHEGQFKKGAISEPYLRAKRGEGYGVFGVAGHSNLNVREDVEWTTGEMEVVRFWFF